MLSLTLFKIFAAKIYLGHDLHFSGSLDVTDYVTIPQVPFSTGVFLYPSRYIQPFSRYAIRFNMFGPKHIEATTRSRDVINHVTNRFAICHFLLVSDWNRASIFNRFRDFGPPKPVHTHRQLTHAASDF